MSMDAKGCVSIRAARARDATAIARLLGELGYPTAVADARERLTRVLARADDGVLVAVVDDEPVAVASYTFIELLESGFHERPRRLVKNLE